MQTRFRHLAVHKRDDGFLQSGLPRGVRGTCESRRCDFFHEIRGFSLHLKAHVHHAAAGKFNRTGIRECKKLHPHFLEGIFRRAVHPREKISEKHRYFAEINFHRTGSLAFQAHRAVIGNVGERQKMLEIYPASGLRFVEEGFRQKTYGNNFVAR